jgi:hypothetical protein
MVSQQHSSDIVADMQHEHVDALVKALDNDFSAKVQAGRLDLHYLEQWAAELQVSDLLERALKESE